MKSNYPRSEHESQPKKPRVWLNAFALGFIFHVLFSRLADSHPFSGLPGRWFGADYVWINIVTSIAALVWMLAMIWQASVWRARSKSLLIVLTGCFGSVMVLPLEALQRNEWVLRESDAVSLAIGWCVVATIYTVICLSIWTTWWLAHRKTAKREQISVVALSSVSIDSLASGVEYEKQGQVQEA